MKKPNLLVLGASGGVANAVLHYLVHHRNIFGKLVLLDKNKKVLSDCYIDHKGLDYTFIHKKIVLPEKENEYYDILKKHKINLVLDVTDMDSIPVIESTNKLGINYINTAMNDDGKTVAELVYYIFSRRNNLTNAVNIFCAGMNPGIVNMWVRYGIEKYGLPKEVIHFEYDSSKVARHWKPIMTWSIHEFITEVIKDPSGVVFGRGKFKKLLPNALEHRVDMKPILSPILKLHKYPKGFTVLHEENLTIAQKYNIPSKFIYAINTTTTENLLKIYNKNKEVTKQALIHGDNTNNILEGSDSIGVLLRYGDKDVYYFNSVPNNAVMGTNATYLQVAVGIFAAIFALLFDGLKKGVYFPEDLFNTHYKYYMFDNIRVQEFVFNKTGGKLKIQHYNPEIKVKRTNHFEHMYL